MNIAQFQEKWEATPLSLPRCITRYLLELLAKSVLSVKRHLTIPLHPAEEPERMAGMKSSLSGDAMKEAAKVFAITVSILSGLLFLGDFAQGGYLNARLEEAVVGVLLIAIGVTGAWMLRGKRQG